MGHWVQVATSPNNSVLGEKLAGGHFNWSLVMIQSTPASSSADTADNRVSLFGYVPKSRAATPDCQSGRWPRPLILALPWARTPVVPSPFQNMNVQTFNWIRAYDDGSRRGLFTSPAVPPDLGQRQFGSTNFTGRFAPRTTGLFCLKTAARISPAIDAGRKFASQHQFVGQGPCVTQDSDGATA